MAKVLYADYHTDYYHTEVKKLEDKLKNEGIEVDRICNREEAGIPFGADEIFFKEYLDKLKDYRVMIAHLGLEFNSDAIRLRNGYPDLNIIIISKFPSHYSESSERILVCDYESDKLIPFVKQALQK